MSASTAPILSPLGLFIQPACLQHKYIRHPNASHIFERPERLRAVLLGVAAAVARLESEQTFSKGDDNPEPGLHEEAIVTPSSSRAIGPTSSASEDISTLLSSLNIATTSTPSTSTLPIPGLSHLEVVLPPLPSTPGQILLHHPALQLAHSPPIDAPFPFLGGSDATVKGNKAGGAIPSSRYMKELLQWATEAVERIKTTGCEIPSDKGLNQGDLYLGPGSVLAIEGAIQTVCQAVDRVVALPSIPKPLDPITFKLKDEPPSTPPASGLDNSAYFSASSESSASSGAEGSRAFRKAFCAIRPPGHHCGEDEPSGFCYVNNVVVGAMHAYLEHDIDRAIIIDFDLHHGNGTQALVMPLNAATHAEELAIAAGKPPSRMLGKDGRPRRGWKGFYGSVHDIYSYPCEDGDLDLVKDASLSLAAHGQYIENIHLQPYTSEADFYTRIYPLYLALLSKARSYLEQTNADPERTILYVSAGFDACEHEHQGMQRHDRRVPVSFFARYTKDIAEFADRYCAGRVVSVLEGGYSDRALTSAAMGHVCGMLGSEGRGEWWDELELGNIERATKKKRTGKLHPFPSDMSHLPHLARTHALLGHFESVGQPTQDVPASLASTPQRGMVASASGRMTLRARKQIEEDGGVGGGDVTPPAPRRGRGRGGVMASSSSSASASVTPSRAGRGKMGDSGGNGDEAMGMGESTPPGSARRGRGRGRGGVGGGGVGGTPTRLGTTTGGQGVVHPLERVDGVDGVDRGDPMQGNADGVENSDEAALEKSSDTQSAVPSSAEWSGVDDLIGGMQRVGLGRDGGDDERGGVVSRDARTAQREVQSQVPSQSHVVQHLQSHHTQPDAVSTLDSESQSPLNTVSHSSGTTTTPHTFGQSSFPRPTLPVVTPSRDILPPDTAAAPAPAPIYDSAPNPATIPPASLSASTSIPGSTHDGKIFLRFARPASTAPSPEPVSASESASVTVPSHAPILASIATGNVSESEAPPHFIARTGGMYPVLPRYDVQQGGKGGD